MKHVEFNLDAGSHKKLTKARKVCVMEAAIVAAGFPYRAVYSAKDCPSSFSHTIASYSIVLNDIMPADLRQKLLGPLIVNLGRTDNAEEIERQRAELIVFETCRRIMPLFCVDVLHRPDLAAEFNIEDLSGAWNICATIRSNIENNLHAIVLSHACLACAYVGDGQTQRAVFQAGKAIEAACGYRPTRQERYFPIAAQILDEAIIESTPLRADRRAVSTDELSIVA
jgi:hypothetical protein